MTSSRLRSGAAVVTLVATAWLTTPSAATALDEAPRLGLTPVDHPGAFFELTLGPGDAAALQVEAANFGASEVEARTYAADVYSIINGGFGADLHGEPATGTTLWLDYPEQVATLGPQAAFVIDFEVAVPAGTPPGEYITALVIENVEPFRGSGSVTVDQVNRSAIAVAIEVPGPDRAQLQIGEVGHHVTGAQSVITFGVDNPGNVHLKPGGDFRVLDASGREVGVGQVTMDSVYAGTGTLLEAPLAELLPDGDYCAELSLVDRATGAADETTCLAFSVETTGAAAPVPSDSAASPLPPWLPSTDAMRQAAPLILVGLAVIVVLVALLMLARRRRGDQMEPVRQALRAEPAVVRAWIVRRDSSPALVVEVVSGTAREESSQIAARLQRRLEDIRLRRPLQVFYLQGAGPTARGTDGATLFYVRPHSPEPLRPAGA